jgi:hypothetical protein
MTFLLQKPGGWTDDIDTITGQQITNIDINLSNALDGASGGAYAPVDRIVIGGVGGLDIQNGVGTIMTGPITLQGAGAHILYRVDRTTITPPAFPSTFTIDTSHDIYMVNAPCINTVAVGVNITNGAMELPAEGQRLTIRKFPDAVNDAVELTLHQDTFAGVQIISLPPLNTLAAPAVNPFVQVELVFNGPTSAWEVLRCHPQCTP